MNHFAELLGPYRKAVTGLVGALLGWALIVVASEPAGITAAEWVGGAVALATGLGVYRVENKEF